MMSSEKSSFTCPLHGHWDCSIEGILSAQAMFAASMNAITLKRNNSVNQLDDDVKSTLGQILRSYFTSKRLEDIIKIERMNIESSAIQIEFKLPFNAVTLKHVRECVFGHALIVGNEDGGGLHGIDDLEEKTTLSPIAIETIQKTLNTLNEAYDKNNNATGDETISSDNSIKIIQQYIETFLHVVGATWILLDFMNVLSFSCAPIPVDTSCLMQFSNVLVSMPIHILSIPNCKSHTETCSSNHTCCNICQLNLDGICLMKQLLMIVSGGKSQDKAGHCTHSDPPPFRLVQPMSIGVANFHEHEVKYEDPGADYNSNTNIIYECKQITLLLGEILRRSTDYCSSLQSENNLTSGSVNRILPSDNTPSSSFVTMSESILGDVLCNEMILLEANIDDMTSEHIAYAVDVLLNIGRAADVWTTSINMKKGRSAHTIHCLFDPSLCNRDGIVKLMFQHTTTLGIRIETISRIALQRTTITVPSITMDKDDGSLKTSDACSDTAASRRPIQLAASRENCIDVKIGYLNSEIVSMKAEFDHCKEISVLTGIPIQQIANDAVEKARRISINGLSVITPGCKKTMMQRKEVNYK